MKGYKRHRLCKVCTLPEDLRDRVDAMLLGEETEEDGRPYSMEGIALWLRAQGHEVSSSSVRRHARHLAPALDQVLQMERLVEAVEEATGKRLSYAAALANIVVHKALRYLQDLELGEEVDPEKVVRLGLEAARVALSLERLDRSLREEAAQKVEESLRARQIEPEVIEAIKRDIYGL
ncbi:phage protein Gp27 family protein [Thermus scotoductus]|uniref:phage protein Gp27 family protein n=1 Tax=Thermus scotoductus TaxID=37636 RepID=UPI001562AED4|nr:phage protein Gp27 family protein [Thermus scotoductus]